MKQLLHSGDKPVSTWARRGSARLHAPSWIYALLVGLNLAAGGWAVYLNNQLILISQQRQQDEIRWAQVQSGIDELRAGSAKINIPGIEVFVSKDGSGELRLLEQYSTAFDSNLEACRGVIARFTDKAELSRIEQKLQAVKLNKEDMLTESRRVIEAFENDGLQAACERMAMMDRGNQQRVDLFTDLSGEIAALKQEDADRRHALTTGMEGGRLFALALILLAALVSASAGHRLIQLRNRGETRTQADLRALEYSESRLRAVLDTAVDAIIVISKRGIVESFNKGAERLFGYDADEVIGNNVFMLMPSPQREEHDSYLAAYAATGVRKIVGIGREVMARRKDGTLFPADLAVSEIDAEGGVRYTGILRDISERKASEELLRRSEQMLHEVGRLAQLGTWELDLETRTLHWSPEVRRIFETADDYEPRVDEATRFFAQQARTAISQALQRAMGQGEPYDLELPAVTASGRSIWVRTLGKTEFQNGRPKRLYGGYQDITERKAAMTALHESEERYDTVVRGSAYGIWDWMVQTGEIYLSDRFREMLGYDVHEMPNHPDELTRHIHPEGIQEYNAAICAHFEKHQPFNIEFRMFTKSRDARWFQARGQAVWDPDGVPVRFAGSIMDITDRKEAEDQLLSYALEMQHKNLALDDALVKAEAATRAKGEFLAKMSHEIRTPMNGVLSMLEFLLESPLSKEQRDFTLTAQDSAGSLLTIINDILDFSKYEAGKVELEHIPFDLRHMVENTVALLAPKAQAKDIYISTLIEPNVPRALIGDPGRLRQIITNLAGNAIKFTRQGGVTVHITLHEEKSDRCQLRFSIRDTGIGIEQTKLNRLFKAFSQVDSSTTREYGGTGLGLAICKQLCELMGGQIGVDSSPGEGSNFWFTVELKIGAQDETAAQHSAVLRGQRVLLATASDQAGCMIESLLQPWGALTSNAIDIQQAQQELTAALIDGNAYDIVILDLDLVHGGLAKVVGLMRSSSGGAAHIIALAAAPKAGLHEHALGAGFEAVLVQPLRQSALLESLADVLGLPELKAKLQAPVIQEGVPETPQFKGRVLLVEDNAVNQQVASLLLKRTGLSFDIAANGREAVTKVQQGHYDLVLMDCQMPEMDGYEATETIRSLGGVAGGLPIIAMTANVMQGDRERCFAAGMNAYISKPINRQDLYAALAQYLDSSSQPGPALGAVQVEPEEASSAAPEQASDAAPAQASNGVPEHSDPQAQVIDLAASVARLGGRDIWEEIAAVFLSELTSRLKQLRDAYEALEWDAMQRHAHTIKGSAAEIAARACSEAAKDVEMSLRAGERGGLDELVSRLESSADDLSQFLAAEIGDRAPA